MLVVTLDSILSCKETNVYVCACDFKKHDAALNASIYKNIYVFTWTYKIYIGDIRLNNSVEYLAMMPSSNWISEYADPCQPREQSSWGQHRAHLGPVGPIWAPWWPHEPCYKGRLLLFPTGFTQLILINLVDMSADINYDNIGRFLFLIGLILIHDLMSSYIQNSAM